MKVAKAALLTVSVFVILLCLLVSTANAQNDKIGIKTIVIDAGHGGPDPGATGRIYKEKDINLDVALRFGKLVSEKYPDVKVIYTRKTDVRIDLQERGNIANRAKADLFFSIHVNSTGSSSPSGVSTYVMGAKNTEKNLSTAMKENSVITYEEDYTAKYEGYKPGSPESFIIFSMMQYAYRTQSCLLADMVQKQFVRHTKMSDRGVQQDGFLVLWKATMPSILTEFGFISNPAEEKYIGSEKGRETYARCLFNAFSEYKVRAEGSGTLIVLDESDTGKDDGGDEKPENRRSTVGSVPPEEPAGNEGGVVYRVQVASSPRKLAKNSAAFGSYRGRVKEMVLANRYKYFVGETATYKEALSLQAEVRRSVKDAFVVPFSGERQITIDEARRRER